MMTRRIICIFGLLAAFVSCVRIETYGGEDERIGLATYALRNTKAGSTYIGGNGNATTNIPVGGKFGVFAYFHPGNDTGNEATSTVGAWDNTTVRNNLSNMLLNECVTRVLGPSEGTYAYTYTNTRYWPKSRYDRISFFAYYPYAANAFVENATNDDTGITLRAPGDAFVPYSQDPYGFPRFRFVVNEDASKQVDFMISDMCLNQSKQAGVLTGSDDDVQFTFHHMLSQIRIKAVGVDKENDAVTVSNVQFKFIGVPVSGIVTPSIPTVPSPIGNGLAPMSFSWSNFNTANSEFTTKIYDDADETEGADAKRQEAIMLMIPHTFSTDPGKDIAEVTFTVTRKDYDNRGESYTYQGKQTVSLAAGGLTGWERNKIYNYTIKVTLDAVEFSVEVEDWPEASADALIKVDLDT